MNEPDGANSGIADQRGRYEAMSDVVLYDLFFEASTQLGTELVARYRMAETAGDLVAAEAWRDRHYAVREEREAIDARDRSAQIDQLLAWQSEREILARTARNPP